MRTRNDRAIEGSTGRHRRRPDRAKDQHGAIRRGAATELFAEGMTSRRTGLPRSSTPKKQFRDVTSDFMSADPDGREDVIHRAAYVRTSNGACAGPIPGFDCRQQ